MKLTPDHSSLANVVMNIPHYQPTRSLGNVVIPW